MNSSSSFKRIRVWDLPTRLFHVLLITCIAGLVITGQVGGDAMRWHFYFGYTVLTLLLFRLVWGVVGGYWSRFAHFVPTPAGLVAYVRALRSKQASVEAGHNPLGALSVLAMLVVLLAQVGSGLLTDDEIANAGPWTTWAPNRWVALASSYHGEIGKLLLIALVVLHLGAVFYYQRIKRIDLIRPMVHGDKTLPEATPATKDTALTRSAALLVLLLCAYAVYRLVNIR